MKKIFLGIFCVAMLSSCFIFRKKVKYGCKTSGSAMGAERLSNDPKAIKAARKSKYKGGTKVRYQ